VSWKTPPSANKDNKEESVPIDLEQYDELVHAIYAAALQPREWHAVLGRMSAAFDASASLLFTPLHSPAQGGFAFTHNIAPATVERWGAKSIRDDLFIQRIVERGLLADGMAWNGDDLVPRAEAHASAFYKELWAPAGLSHGCMGVVFSGGDARQLPTATTLFRGPGAEPYTPAHAGLLRRLLTHLSRSLGVMYHLRDQQLHVAATLAALDQLPGAVVLLDATGRSTFVSRAADALLRRSDVVTTRPGAGDAVGLRLAAPLRAQEAAFQALLRRALQPLRDAGADGADAYFSDALVLTRPDGRPACVIHAAPLGASHGFDTGARAARAIVFLYELDSATRVRPELLCELFGLTLAEARAALQVLHGGRVPEMAERLGVSANTFKTQLRLAYEKTHTHRQADLLKLLLALVTH
jgi:DNA-binding CsgD family transcriptional regulator